MEKLAQCIANTVPGKAHGMQNQQKKTYGQAIHQKHGIQQHNPHAVPPKQVLDIIAANQGDRTHDQNIVHTNYVLQ